MFSAAQWGIYTRVDNDWGAMGLSAYLAINAFMMMAHFELPQFFLETRKGPVPKLTFTKNELGTKRWIYYQKFHFSWFRRDFAKYRFLGKTEFILPIKYDLDPIIWCHSILFINNYSKITEAYISEIHGKDIIFQ